MIKHRHVFDFGLHRKLKPGYLPFAEETWASGNLGTWEPGDLRISEKGGVPDSFTFPFVKMSFRSVSGLGQTRKCFEGLGISGSRLVK